MKLLTEFTTGDKVRWFYQINKWTKPTDEIVFISCDPISTDTHIQISRIDKNGNYIKGGVVRKDELYEVE